MSRVLSFGDDEVGIAYIRQETGGEQVPAKGDIEVPEGAVAMLLLEPAASPDLPFLSGLEPDVVAMVKAEAVSPEGIALLAQQTGLKQLMIGSALDDAAVGCLGDLPGLQMLDVTLEGPAGPGVASLAGGSLSTLYLHGNAGDSLAALAQGGISTLHVHLAKLTADALVQLAAATAVESLDIEVEAPLTDPDEELRALLADVVTGLKSLSLTTADGADGLGSAVRLTVLEANPDLTLNGVTYAPAALSRLRRAATG